MLLIQVAQNLIMGRNWVPNSASSKLYPALRKRCISKARWVLQKGKDALDFNTFLPGFSLRKSKNY